ncbi:unnamed protein product [Nippostrongylus brasiliensis]|uniref:Putative nuclease HARBI1 n=1 Tax=Nippostrongylus brasiliensis TaxID=27835 RepID=A0A0N4Y3G6_NIPBR|nr:hypothetical protein Q1695_009129 [Nippostrongylus brasiliensis]VDL73941.1 unnamed protein product [Nippostrongylus brasiliensis]
MERKRAVHFHRRELVLLMDLYIKNYASYHGSFTSGGRVGRGVRDKFHEEWAQAVSGLGVAPRSKSQIEEKIKNERKRVHRFIMEEKERLASTGEGRPPLIMLPSYLEPLLHYMTDKYDNGIPGIVDYVADPHDNFEDLPGTSEVLGSLFADEDDRNLYGRPRCDIWEDDDAEVEHPTEVQRETRKRSYASIARESLTAYMDETKLVKLQQQLEIATTEIRKMEMEKLKVEMVKLKMETERLALEMEVMRAKKQFSEAHASPTSPTYYYFPSPAVSPVHFDVTENHERQLNEKPIRRIASRRFRHRLSPLDVQDDATFRHRFRLSRHCFRYVLGLIGDDLNPQTARSRSLTNSQKLGIFLETIGSSNLQRTTGVALGCSQSTVSRVIRDVSEVFWRRRNEFILWPTEEEQTAMSERFFDICRIPKVVGAIDGTHVKIIAPTESEDSYVNRKGYHSINVGAVADLDSRFIWLSVAFPGKTHDSKVFRMDALYDDLRSGRRSGVLLGDGAYRLEPFLLKPFLGEDMTEPQVRFTEALQEGRACVARAFGALKRQFQSLQIELQYSPQTAAKIINAAVCLRNLCIDMGESDFDDVEANTSYVDAGDVQYNGSDVEDESERDLVVREYFQSENGC